ncbi:metallophosphoesterase [Agaribacterium haliotis]|uniref:metallophosphoesterase n=1 Tax=Agaribacterium haliotis TaxID=2013869 RepID=UPI000BB597C1|nr:metallophosphoesterase [Agaribacterium haliotis]
MNTAVVDQAGIDGIDIIGDVHGCAHTLEKLLHKLDYREQDGVWFHPKRKAVFVGDVIDRGPRIRESLKIVRRMVESGRAWCILGNHEFNAVAYTTVVEELDDPRFLRKHDKRNNRLIQETLVQFAPYPEEWRSYLSWFKSLPLFLEFDHCRVVHACWHDASVAHVQRAANSQRVVLNDIFERLVGGDTALLDSLDRLTRGTSLRYPDQRYVVSRDGIKREIFRTKFWARNPQTYQDVVFQPDPLPEDLVERPLSIEERAKLVNYQHAAPPVFFGHYWLQGRPRVQAGNLCCLDYSAVKYGRLVAYRFDGEAKLDNNKFHWVYVNPDVQDE